MIINDGKRHQCAPHLHSLSEHHQPVTTTPDDKYADPFPTLSEHACKRKFDNEKHVLTVVDLPIIYYLSAKFG